MCDDINVNEDADIMKELQQVNVVGQMSEVLL